MQCTHFHFAQNRGWERKKTKPEEDQKERGGDQVPKLGWGLPVNKMIMKCNDIIQYDAIYNNMKSI